MLESTKCSLLVVKPHTSYLNLCAQDIAHDDVKPTSFTSVPKLYPEYADGK